MNPYKLYFIFGKKGAGKTTYETKLACKYLKKGWNVYTDLPELYVPGIRFFPYEQLGDFVPEEHSLLILGEAGIKFDARHFKDFKPSLRDFFAFQRKYKVICYMDSQTFDVDKKIRDRTDAMFLQVNFLRVFSIGKRIIKKITLVEATSQGESRIAENLVFAPIWMWTFTYIPAWAGKFDSNAVIDRKPYLDYTVVGADAFSAPIPDDPAEALAELNARNRWAAASNSLRSRFRHKSVSPVLDGLDYEDREIPSDEDLDRNLPEFLR
ncbi:MAG: hypothetical protein IKU20_08910 [Lachnospiraceae bacterium]|nr:hypothetical protein [Lachnospiraceae bacterium]